MLLSQHKSPNGRTIRLIEAADERPPGFSLSPPPAPLLTDKAQTAAVICGCIVAFAYSANYTNHAPLAPALMREFGFNNALAGLLTTGIFATHAGMQIPGGYLVDRLGSRRVLLCALIWVAWATSAWRLPAHTGSCFFARFSPALEPVCASWAARDTFTKRRPVRGCMWPRDFLAVPSRWARDS